MVYCAISQWLQTYTWNPYNSSALNKVLKSLLKVFICVMFLNEIQNIEN